MLQKNFKRNCLPNRIAGQRSNLLLQNDTINQHQSIFNLIVAINFLIFTRHELSEQKIMILPQDYYQTLSLKRDCEDDEIRHAYRKLALKVRDKSVDCSITQKEIRSLGLKKNLPVLQKRITFYQMACFR